MSALSFAADMPDDWLFAESESKPVAVHGSLMDRLRDNAPQIGSGLQLLEHFLFNLA